MMYGRQDRPNPVRLVITEAALMQSYRYLGWSPELVASEKERGAFTNPVVQREMKYPGVPAVPISGDAVRSVGMELQKFFNTKVYSYFVIHAQELPRALEQFAREEIPYGPTSPWASCPRIYCALRELYSLLYGTPPPINRRLILSMDLTLDNQRTQLVRAAGGRFSHLAGQVGNVPRSCSTNAQTVMDLVLRRDEAFREKRKRKRASRNRRIKERDGIRYVDRTILRRGAKLGLSKQDIIDLRGTDGGGVQRSAGKGAPVKLTLQEYRNRKTTKPTPSSTVTSAPDAQEEDLRVQLNRGREQLGFAQPLGGSYTRRDKYSYKVRVQEAESEEVEMLDVRTIRRVVPMDESDDEVNPLDQVGDWIDDCANVMENYGRESGH